MDSGCSAWNTDSSARARRRLLDECSAATTSARSYDAVARKVRIMWQSSTEISWSESLRRDSGGVSGSSEDWVRMSHAMAVVVEEMMVATGRGIVANGVASEGVRGRSTLFKER